MTLTQLKYIVETAKAGSISRAAEKLYISQPSLTAAIRELEKIELCRHLDNVYRMDHAVTKTQKEILSAFGIESSHVKYKADFISEALREGTK